MICIFLDEFLQELVLGQRYEVIGQAVFRESPTNVFHPLLECNFLKPVPRWMERLFPSMETFQIPQQFVQG